MAKQIGKLSVVVSANTAQFTAGMRAAAAEAKRFSEVSAFVNTRINAHVAAEAAAFKRLSANVNAGVDAYLERMRAAEKSSGLGGVVSGFKAIRRHALFAVGVTGLIFAGVEHIREALDGAGRAAALINKFGKDYAANVETTRERLNEVEASLGHAAGFWGGLGRNLVDILTMGGASEGLREERTALEGALAVQKTALQVQKEHEKIRERAAAFAERESRVRSALSEMHDAFNRTLPDTERRQAEHFKRMSDLAKEAAKETDAAIRKILRDRIQFEQQAFRQMLADEKADRLKDQEDALAGRLRKGEAEFLRKSAIGLRDQASREASILGSRPELQALVAGTAEAEAFKFDSGRPKVEEKQLKALEEMAETLDKMADDIENMADEDGVTVQF